MVRIIRQLEFSAAHRYHRPEWSPERNRAVFGLCNLAHGHGHDYLCQVTLEGRVDPRTGMVINLTELDRAMNGLILEELEGRFLDRECDWFAARVPTCENLARFVWQGLAPGVGPARLVRVRIEENSRLYVEHVGEEHAMLLTRVYEFACAHRLHTPTLSEEENRRIYGKCNNLHGHGHNYRLEVTVRGPIDEVTGMVINIAELDAIVEEEVYARYDHRHLNLDTDEFRDRAPTSENFIMVLWEHLSSRLTSPRLHRLVLRETSKNFFEYYGPEAEPAQREG